MYCIIDFPHPYADFLVLQSAFSLQKAEGKGPGRLGPAEAEYECKSIGNRLY